MKEARTDLVSKDCGQVLGDALPALDGLRGEHVLVTGGTGFIGSWLVELVSFLNDHHDFNTRLMLLANRAHRFIDKAPHLATRKDITLISRDVRSTIELPSEVGWIIHAAGNPDNRLHASDPAGTIDVVIRGTASILEASTRLPNLKKFLNISSGLVNGPQPFDLDALGEHWYGGIDCSSVSSAYAEAKRVGETLCAAYRSQYRLPIVNARPFAFIGPYQSLDRPWAINNFIRDGLLGGPIRILGDGETVRSYMYPSDMALWLLRILLHGKVGLTYNVGSPEGLTLRQLAEKIAGYFPTSPRILLGLAIDRGVHRSKFVPDVSLAQKDLGLELKVSLEEAIRRTILWNKEQSKKHGAAQTVVNDASTNEE